MPGNIINPFDNVVTEGLDSTKDSLSYRIAELDRHVHNQEKWFGAAAVAAGETHVADEMNGVIAPFVLLSGNSDFGNWVQILGSTDTPVKADQKYIDAHRFLVTGTDSTAAFVIQIIGGESADLAALVAAKQYSAVPYIASSNLNDSGISDVLTRRVSVGTKVWARASCIGQNAKTINIYYGLHEYEG